MDLSFNLDFDSSCWFPWVQLSASQTQFLHLYSGDNIRIRWKTLCEVPNKVPGTCSTFVSPGFSSRNRSGPLSRDLAGLPWCHSSLQFQTGLLACGQGVYSKAFLCASSGLRLLWSCSSFHGAHVCDRVCPALKVLWWKCLCAKSSINIKEQTWAWYFQITPNVRHHRRLRS
jgi:hypothetical protein